MITFFERVSQSTDKYYKLWENTTGDISTLRKYSNKEKRIIKKQINQSLSSLTEKIKQVPEDKEKRMQWQNELKENLKVHAKPFLNINNADFESIMTDGCTDVAETFFASARKFDKDIKAADIYQAIRNVWIMNVIQAIQGMDIVFTKSIFAYSMLYPYTDNFLDDPKISAAEKKQFNQRLGCRLEGQDIQPENKHEKQIFDLVSMIEAEYDREKHPEVFSSIINIHQGQCKSIIQQDDSPDSKSSDILKISIEKGSASVLADAYLVCGDVDIALFDLMFGFGFVLQLIDDLQDAVEDYENSHKTLFSQKVYSEKLDNLTSKLISFTMNSLDFDSCKKSKYIAEIKKLIVDNTLRLVFKAVWDNRKLYSRRYIRQFKRFTPYDYNYIRKKTDKLKLEFKKLDGLI